VPFSHSFLFSAVKRNSPNDLVGSKAWYPPPAACRRKPDIAISVGAGRCALQKQCLKSAQPTPTRCQHIKEHNSAHGDPAFGAVGNFEEQELPLQLALCYRGNAKRGAASVLPVTCNHNRRQQKLTDRRQTKARIWQRATTPQHTTKSVTRHSGRQGNRVRSKKKRHIVLSQV
jgi:hypothetical protein